MDEIIQDYKLNLYANIVGLEYMEIVKQAMEIVMSHTELTPKMSTVRLAMGVAIINIIEDKDLHEGGKGTIRTHTHYSDGTCGWSIDAPEPTIMQKLLKAARDCE